ncbi:MAG: hypothetical protein HYR72_19150 [Deltaproteobacteria bacterium]|nr:hypothetical protein [Deltaproteobacteria bacterium]MBI3386164.1 hypothetical protein [Deltaproteobacteria bacterium]
MQQADRRRVALQAAAEFGDPQPAPGAQHRARGNRRALTPWAPIATAVLVAAWCVPARAQSPHYLPDDLQRFMTQVRFFDANHGFVYDSGPTGTVIATDDGGANWRVILDPPASYPVDGIDGVFFSDAQHLWILTGRGQKLYRSKDAGRTLDIVTPAIVNPRTGGSDRLSGFLFFRTETEGWVKRGIFLKTTDAGATWTPVLAAKGEAPFNQFWMFDSQEGIGVGGENRGFNGLYRTLDGGVTWAPVQNSPQLRDLSCRSDGFCVGLASQYGSVFVSRDRGQTWLDTHIPLQGDAQDEIHEVQAAGSNLVVAAGTDNGFTRSWLRSYDGTGTPVPEPQPPRALLLKWDGSTWARISYDTPKNLSGVSFTDATNGWVTTYDEGLYKTTDGGQTLQFVPDYFRQIAARTPSPTPFPTAPWMAK